MIPRDDSWLKGLIVIICSVAASIPANIGVQKSTAEVRSDPFTGTDGRAMRQDLKNDILELRQDFEEYKQRDEERVHSMEQRMAYLKDRIEALHGK